MEELAKLKVDLRALVVSCPTVINAQRLLQDYREMIGKHLPFAKFGFSDPVAFFREKCSDCFLFEGDPLNPVLTPIVPTSLKHIDQMISRQKLCKRDKGRSKRRSIPEEHRPAHRALANELQYKIITKATPSNTDNKPSNNSRDNNNATNTRERALNDVNNVTNRMQKLLNESDKSGPSVSQCFEMEELAKLKVDLRALVVSCPTVINAQRLLQDYREMIGKHLPFAKFGFSDPVAFFREKCSDCFLFEGDPLNPVLTPIVPTSLKHIDQMISRQKLCKRDKGRSKRRSIPEEHRPAHRALANELQYKIITKATPSNTDNKPSNNSRDNNNATNTRERALNDVNNVTNRMQKLLNESDKSGPSVSQKDVSTGKSEDKGQEVSEEGRNSSNEVSKKASSSDVSDQANIGKLLDNMRERLDVLLAEHPEGIWCVDIMTLYKERFGRPLAYRRVGCSSVISLMRRFPDLMHISRPQPAGDWMLSLARINRPNELRFAALRQAMAKLAARSAEKAAKRGAPHESALPGVPYEEGVFPMDCIQPGRALPDLEVGLSIGDELDVTVGEVYSPSHLWLLRLGKEHYEELDRLMVNMTRYYTGLGASRVLSTGAAQVGHYCAGRYEGEWHRSLIVRALDSDHVMVRHVDFGTVEAVEVRTLRPLRLEYTDLPAQAMRARLTGVRSAAAGARWPVHAGAAVLKAVRGGRIFRARVCSTGRDGALHVLLRDGLLCLNTQLVAQGHAEKHPLTSEYLPTFSALEVGATPTWSELWRLECTKVGHDSVEVPPPDQHTLPLTRYDARLFRSLVDIDESVAFRHILKVITHLLDQDVPEVGPAQSN